LHAPIDVSGSKIVLGWLFLVRARRSNRRSVRSRICRWWRRIR